MFTLKLEVLDGIIIKDRHMKNMYFLLKILSKKLIAYNNGQISRFEFMETVPFKYFPNV